MTFQKEGFYKGLFWGAIAGAAVGTVMGMLFAPQRGNETRRMIADALKIPRKKSESEFDDNLNGMPVPNSIPPKPNSTPADIENEAKLRAEAIVAGATADVKHILNEANLLLREVKSQSEKLSDKTQKNGSL